jgi:hypothetical protein
MLKAAKVYSYTAQGSPQTCTLFVWQNGSGKPAGIVHKQAYSPSASAWDRIDLPSPIAQSSDFWMGVRIPKSGANVTAVVVDQAQGYYSRVKAAVPGILWWVSPEITGDLLIRAIVDYAAVEDSPVNRTLILKQNAPNPAIGATTIAYVLPETMKMRLEIYDVTGGLVRTLSDQIHPAGAKQVIWDRRCGNGKAVPSGTYFYTLTVGNRSFTKAMTVL